ncbi:MAG TPA: peptidoglycan editing factor PgeF [Bacteroidota bacterium]|nr:peptidoglycan editing factor PgeF [Bacteroidota bacterium]
MPDVYTSTLLTSIPCVRFGMSTRRGGTDGQEFFMNMSYHVGDRAERVDANRRAFFEALGIQDERLAYPKQCHSARILAVNQGGTYESCDGLVTAEKHLWLAVSVADCVPLILVDTRQHIVAALHAGWRGTVGRIAERGVDLMRTRFGTRPSDLKAYIGPSAGVCCYTVGEEVFSQFSEGVLVQRNGSVHLDLKKENKRQLLGRGVPEEHIEVSPHCTICTPDLFHSYRRDRERSGRMMAAIALIS